MRVSNGWSVKKDHHGVTYWVVADLVVLDSNSLLNYIIDRTKKETSEIDDTGTGDVIEVYTLPRGEEALAVQVVRKATHTLRG